MPRGVVIAVTPDSFVSDSDVMYARSKETGSQYTSRTGGRGNANKLYLIGVFKVTPSGRITRKIDSVVVYKETKYRYEEGTIVDFEIDSSHPRSISLDEAVQVHKIGSLKSLLIGGSLLSTVALFTSSLLVFAVLFDREKWSGRSGYQV